MGTVFIITVVIHPQRKLRNHAHKESNPYFTKNYLNYVTQDTTEMMGQLLRSVFTTVWGEEIKTPGLIENRDAEAMNQQQQRT